MYNDNSTSGCLAVIIMLGIILGLLMIQVNVNSIACKKKAIALGYKCQFSIFTGCILEKPDGKKILLEQLRDYN